MHDNDTSSRTGADAPWLAALGGLAACAGVALDALNAHAFAQRFDVHALGVLATAARYLLVHGLLLLVVARWRREAGAAPLLKLAGWLAATGIVLFCAGLIASTLSGVHWLGKGAPWGGTAFMAAWLTLGLHGLRHGVGRNG